MKKGTSFRFEESRINKLKEIAARRGESMQATLDRMIDLIAAQDSRDPYPFAEDALNALTYCEQQLDYLYTDFSGEEELPEPPEVADLKKRVAIASMLIASSEVVTRDARSYAPSLDPEEQGQQVFRFGNTEPTSSDAEFLRNVME